MGRCRFVQPTVVRLPLSEGDYIDVKQELTAAEQRRIFSGLVKEMTAGAKTVLDPALVGKTKIVEYLIGWSLVGADGHPEPVSESALDGLDVDTYREIEQAIDAHDERVEVARAARKNGQGIASPSPVISPSPSVVTGPLVPFVN